MMNWTVSVGMRIEETGGGTVSEVGGPDKKFQWHSTLFTLRQSHRQQMSECVAPLPQSFNEI